MTTVRIPLCLLLLFFFSHSFSQRVVNTTGTTVANSAFVVEYSVGEVAITTLNSDDKNVTQGLLQPILKVVNPSCAIINSDLLSFENPTKNKVRLVGNYDWITDYQVYAVDGKLVEQAKFYNNYIDISRLPAALYFIRLFPGCDGNYRVIKVIKQ